jgi:uncharacterized protein
MPNRLAHETSPYLRQHADNPVDWYPFGEEALQRAVELDLPLFISIGYAACHWCHVMAHESFENPAIAEVLNSLFVAVKIDREERPDLDAIYMEAVQAQTGGGGWPMSVFATPDGRPFYAGTYFPPRPSHQLPSFSQVLGAVSEAWTKRRAELIEHARELTASVEERLAPLAPTGPLPPAPFLVKVATERMLELFDPEFGGIGRAPKFPQTPMLELALLSAHLGLGEREPLRNVLSTSLDHMAAGGLYDQVGGGFHRYSVDRIWLVPHFEKMLYDQAALARVYLHGFLAEGKPRWRQVVEETIGYMLGDLAGPDGGLCASEDADSPGGEGRFYTWSPEEFDELLGEEADAARRFFQLEGAPNFEGRFILHTLPGDDPGEEAALARWRAALCRARSERERPARDEKVLTEWNAMAIATIAEAGAALSRPDWVHAAVELVDFLLARLRREDGRLLRSYIEGRSANLGLCEDYAWLIEALTRVFEAMGERRFVREATALADEMITLFSAPDGGVFQTGADAPELIVRPRDSYDGVLPAGSSIAASALARLGAITGAERFTERATEIVAASAGALSAGPVALSHLLATYLQLEEGIVEVVLPGRDDLARRCQERYLPGTVLVWGERDDSPLFAEREDGLAYLCRAGVCFLPIADGDELLDAIAVASSPHR